MHCAQQLGRFQFELSQVPTGSVNPERLLACI